MEGEEGTRVKIPYVRAYTSVGRYRCYLGGWLGMLLLGTMCHEFHFCCSPIPWRKLFFARKMRINYYRSLESWFVWFRFVVKQTRKWYFFPSSRHYSFLATWLDLGGQRVRIKAHILYRFLVIRTKTNVRIVTNCTLCKRDGGRPCVKS